MLKRLALSLAGATALSGCSTEPVPIAPGAGINVTLAHEHRLDGSPGRESAFSSDGKLLAASAAGGRVDILRLADMRRLRSITHARGVASVAFSADGSTLATGGYDGTVRLWDVQTARALRTLRGAAGTIWSVDFAPGGTLLAAAGEDATIRLWDTADGHLQRNLKGHARNIWRVRFSPDGKHIASGSFDATVKVWNVSDGALARDLLGHEQAVVGLDYSPDGRLIASGSDDSTIRIWSAGDGRLVRALDNGNHVYTVHFSPDGKWLASGGRARGAVATFWHQITSGGGAVENVRLWRMADGAVVAVAKHREDVMSVAISPEGRWLASASEDSVTLVWAVQRRRLSGRTSR